MRLAPSFIALAFAAICATPSAYAADSDPERGWFWGFFESLHEALEEEEEQTPPASPPETPEKEPQEQDCTDPEQWTVECGFVDPKGDFAFQSAQQKELLNHATMNPNDPQAVEGFQRYMKWAINQSITMARVWKWNMLQNQDLNPRSHTPVSAFGLRAAMRVEDAYRDSVIAEIRDQGGFLVWFTRSTCPYCHDMRETMLRIGRNTQLEIWNASLDGECMEGFEELCRFGKPVIEAARRLNIASVPDLWLYLPQDDVWFRISSGIESVETITARLELFFGAVRRAALKGLENGKNGSPSVDFSVPDILERSKGGHGYGVPQALEQ